MPPRRSAGLNGAPPDLAFRGLSGTRTRVTGFAGRHLASRSSGHECARRESNPHVRRHTGLSRARLPLRHSRIRADDGSRTRGLHLGKVTRCQLRHVRMEPPAGTDPAASSLPRTCSAIELRRREAGRAGVEPASLVPGQSRAAPADRATGHREPATGLEPVTCPIQGGRSA